MRHRLLPILLLLCCFSLSGCMMVRESTYVKKSREADQMAADLAELQQRYRELSAEKVELQAKLARQGEELRAALGERDRITADRLDLEKLLQTRSDSLSRNLGELRQKISELERDKGRLQQEISSAQVNRDEEERQTSVTFEALLEEMKGEIAQGQVSISELQGTLTVNLVDAVLFDSGKAEFREEGVAVLRKVVAALKGAKDKQVRVEGHTDNVPIAGFLSRQYASNWELSAARAVTVTRYLQEQGIDPQSLVAVAYGEYRPVASNDSEEGRRRNRRIEILLIPKEAP